MYLLTDANNYVRRKLETDVSGMTPRELLHEVTMANGPVIYVWDSENCLKARRAIFPGYKAKRKPASTDMFVGFDLVQSVLRHSKAVQLTIPGFEADDIIAQLTRQLASAGHRVLIKSTDRDFLQLVAEFPTLVNVDTHIKEGVLLEHIRHHKTLVGDPSDNIPGIPGFGAKAWEEADKAQLTRWLELVAHGLEAGPFPAGGKAAKTWADQPENRQTLANYWDIIGFLSIPEELIQKHLVVGDSDRAAADRILLEYMQ